MQTDRLTAFTGGAGFFVPWVSPLLYVAVALWWPIPDRRIERTLTIS